MPKIAHVYKWQNLIWPGLPAGYKKVEYITNAASTRINTGIYSDIANMRFKIKVQSVTWSFYIFQSRNSNSVINGISGSTSGNKIHGANRDGTALVYSSFTRDTSALYILDYTIGNWNYSFYAENVSSWEVDQKQWTYSTSLTPNGAEICIRWNTKWNAIAAWADLYYAQLWKDWALAFDWIPCKRISDGIYWLYDKVSRAFFWATTWSISWPS